MEDDVEAAGRLLEMVEAGVVLAAGRLQVTLFPARRIVPLVVTGRHNGAHPLTVSGAIVAVVQPLHYQHGARTKKNR